MDDCVDYVFRMVNFLFFSIGRLGTFQIRELGPQSRSTEVNSNFVIHLIPFKCTLFSNQNWTDCNLLPRRLTILENPSLDCHLQNAAWQLNGVQSSRASIHHLIHLNIEQISVEFRKTDSRSTSHLVVALDTTSRKVAAEARTRTCRSVSTKVRTRSAFRIDTFGIARAFDIDTFSVGLTSRKAEPMERTYVIGDLLLFSFSNFNFKCRKYVSFVLVRFV